MPLTDTQRDAQQIIRDALQTYGLESLNDWALTRLLAGDTPAVVLGALRDTPQYAARFPAMAELRRRGQAITEGQYVDYEKTIAETARTYGLATQMFDKQYIADMLTSNVSAREFESRATLAKQASMTAPKETKDALASLYGVTQNDLATYWLDPDKSLPILQRKYDAAAIAGAGLREKFTLDRATAERLAGQGATEASAVQDFAQAAQLRGLTRGLENTVSEADIIGSAFGGGEQTVKVQQAQQQRKSSFQGGGGAQETQGGVTGLGVAATR